MTDKTDVTEVTGVNPCMSTLLRAPSLVIFPWAVNSDKAVHSKIRKTDAVAVTVTVTITVAVTVRC